jgi:hypothetical protein
VTIKMGLEDYMAMPWVHKMELTPDGTYRLTVPPLKGFEVFGSKALVEAEWQMALKGYLRACLAAQKAIPLPPNAYPESCVRTGELFVGWAQQQVA